MGKATWTPRKQGDAGERSAVMWLWSVGAFVFVPFGHSPDYDLVADLDGKVLRVQVKTSTCWSDGRFVVALCTRGGNQSWNGIVKKLDATRCDYLFVHVGDGRRWFIPAVSLEAASGLTLGGPKYAEFEVEPGEPLQGRSAAQ
jgi:hypothetical protein